MDFKNNKIFTAGLFFSLILPTTVYATNGMQSAGNGAKASGMGGAGVALANETGSIVTNPAAVVGMDDRLDVAIALFSPSPRGYEITGNNAFNPFTNLGIGTFNTDQQSTNDLFLIPFFGMAFNINYNSAWSISVSAAGGMNTEYQENFGANILFPAQFTEKTGINIEQVYLSATYGLKLSKNTSFGISALYAYQQMEATGLGIFGFLQASDNSEKLSNNGTDSSSGLGYKVGLQTGFSDLTFGISYQPKIIMSKLEKYSGLLANQGELDIPATLTAGMAWKITSKLLIALDYHTIDYADIDAIGNSLTKLTSEGKQFGSTDGPGFGWQSIDIIKFGIAYEYSPNWTFRTGWNRGDSPVVEQELSVAFLAPAVITDHFTLGFTNKINKTSEYTIDFVHSFYNSMTGNFSPLFGGGEITVEMEQNQLEFGYSKLF